MYDQIKALYYFETEHANLDYCKFPEYRERLAQAETLWDNGEMPRAFFKLLDVANRISFVHGFRLGLRLAQWAERGTKGGGVLKPPFAKGGGICKANDGRFS